MQAGSRPAEPVVDVRGLRKAFSSAGSLTRSRRVVAAEDVSFRIHRGEAVALVGESGSGKSTIAKLLLRLERPDGGEIRIDGADVLSRERRRASVGYRRRVQMVFQDPFGSLNPVHDVAHHLIRPLLRHRRAAPPDARRRAADLLRTVGLEPAEDYLGRHPYELSGGQRQRVAIARALAVEPDVLVADEPTSMLDVSIRMDILNLLARLKRDRGLAILLITHDLASARFLAERVLVLFQGRVVESGSSADVVSTPLHPYTRALVDAIADDRPRDARSPHATFALEAPTGSGCPFASRCPEVFDPCLTSDPGPTEVDGREVRCHLHRDAHRPGSTGVQT